MKCSKIVLAQRQDKPSAGRRDVSVTRPNPSSGIQRYSSRKLSNCQTASDPEPQLTITTLIFPDDVRFNTGSSLDRWNRKSPPLAGGNRKCRAPSGTFQNEEERPVRREPEPEPPERADVPERYVVTSDIEALMMPPRRQRNVGKKRRGTKKIPDDARAAPKRHKTIRFAIGQPPSPGTEQIIRVDVTSNVSLDSLEMTSDSLTDDRPGDLATAHPEMEEEFIIKCKQLALSRKD